MAPEPLPVRIPPSGVVEPVPPYTTPRDVVATTTPLALVVRSAEARLVVMAPVLETEKSVEVAEAVDEPMAKRVVAVSPLLVCIESLAYGDEVPIPRAPDVGSTNVEAEVVAGSVPKTKLPRLNWLLAVALGKRVLKPIPMLLPPVVI